MELYDDGRIPRDIVKGNGIERSSFSGLPHVPTTPQPQNSGTSRSNSLRELTSNAVQVCTVRSIIHMWTMQKQRVLPNKVTADESRPSSSACGYG